MHSAKICCLIPAFNEALCISSVIKEAKKHIKDIIVVDDGSSDATGELAQQEGAFVIKHNHNLGKGMALRTGFSHALKNSFDAVITLDADGQHNPFEINKFLNAFQKDSGDLIIGARLWNKTSMPLYRYIPNRIGVYCISTAAGCKITDTQSGFRLYKKGVLEKINLATTGFETETEILIKAGKKGFRIHNLPVSVIYQQDYKTHFRPVRDFYRISMLFLRLTILGGFK